MVLWQEKYHCLVVYLEPLWFLWEFNGLIFGYSVSPKTALYQHLPVRVPNKTLRDGKFAPCNRTIWHHPGMFISSPIDYEKLVGGFNPSEKYQSKWESSPNRGENKKCLKPPARKSPQEFQGCPS